MSWDLAKKIAPMFAAMVVGLIVLWVCLVSTLAQVMEAMSK